VADDPNLEPGKSINIATRGISTGKPITVATDGFIIPIVGDIIMGGEADVVFVPATGNIFDYTGSGGFILGGMAVTNRAYIVVGDGGLITAGIADVNRVFSYTGTGGLVIGGESEVSTSFDPVIEDGNIVTGGMAGVSRAFTYIGTGGITTGGMVTGKLVFNFAGSGGLVTNGQAFVNISLGITGSGGIITGGMVDANTTGQAGFGRGGAIGNRRVPRLPNTEFEFPIYNPDDYLQPMDYLKKIQDTLDKVKQEKQQLFNHLSKGTLSVSGRGKITAVFRDQPDGEVVVANNPPLEPIILELPNVFSRGATAREIRDFEDSLLLNDIIGTGNYRVETGEKVRYIQKAKKKTSGAAKVSFVRGAAATKLVSRDDKIRDQDDDAILLDMLPRSRQDQEEEELRLLGIID